ncbi:MAG: alpha/beta hydrolase domain-containing protein [Acidobacteriota bacterium]
MPRAPLLFACLAAATLTVASPALADVVRLDIVRREVVLGGQPFGLAGPYEKLSGTVRFEFDPDLPQNRDIVDLGLAPRNARGRVEASADFYLLKPVDPLRGNGRLFYEAGNRGTKRILATFQGARTSEDPTTAEEFGNGALMRQGFTLAWMGWQWDVPDGRMRMELPIPSDDGRPITGWVRANFIPGARDATARLADRGHRAYPVVDPESAEHRMTVRDRRLDPPTVVPRARWRFVDQQTVALDGGFEPGRIYDVVYRARDPRVVGIGLAGTRDFVSFLKGGTRAEHPVPGLRWALGWGVSQTGRFLRHFLYQGFNEDERGRRVFDGVFDQVGGAGRGSFNHRFGQASRDALHHYNILFPVDMFPFTDSVETDPETGESDGLLLRAVKSGTTPKVFHLLTNSEYFNRAGSLVHTTPDGRRDAALPDSTRIYFIASAPHIVGAFPPAPSPSADLPGQAPMNTLNYSAVVRALFRALDRWVVDDAAPPASRYPRLDDGTLTPAAGAGWPKIPGMAMPLDPMPAYRLDFGPDWARGIVANEPPRVGAPFPVLVPAVDADGNDRAGIRLPDIEVPLATQKGWNFRHPSSGASDRLAGEIGAYFAFPLTRADRERAGDARVSIQERYRDRFDYLGRISEAALKLVADGYLLAEDLPEVIERASRHYDWATRAAASQVRGLPEK